MGFRSLSVLCGALLVVRLADAAGPAAATVAFTDCESEPLGKQIFLRALTLELGRGPLRETAPESAAIVVNYRCDGIAVVQIHGAQTKRRELRTDDVALKERARALALSVGEFARAGDEPRDLPDAAHEAPAKDTPEPEKTAEKAVEPPKRTEAEKPRPVAPARPASTPRDDARSGSAPPLSQHFEPAVVHLNGGVRFNPEVEAFYYGGALGLDLKGFRPQLEVFGAHTDTPRGSVSSGVSALRLGHTLPLLHMGVVEAGVIASAAAGANWAVGDSSVPNTRVRRVLMPYADAHVGVWATSAAHVPFTPLCEVYAGRAAGIVANVDGGAVLATGAWFTGIDLGLWL